MQLVKFLVGALIVVAGSVVANPVPSADPLSGNSAPIQKRDTPEWNDPFHLSNLEAARERILTRHLCCRQRSKFTFVKLRPPTIDYPAYDDTRRVLITEFDDDGWALQGYSSHSDPIKSNGCHSQRHSLVT
ncbi:hypothetical protein PIIN_07662 [Serendipita indica DSM 11827]|uniref:Uncharacterized protein n=1 Tax=Serendipita indica (strain DSM 11827) TaxID=1109443 RepID=G4TQW5_SERID|nr:hypothetical protein PIIN_07662 [Serendipita indica DSM 11827]